MRPDLLQVLHCPHCGSNLDLETTEETTREIRSGSLACHGRERHRFAIENGIVQLATGFDHDAVQREIAYEDSTYDGDHRLRDQAVISNFPETLPLLWPHVRHFGPDFRGLIERLTIGPGSWVLDVGTAACWSTRLLAERGARAIALDVNGAEYYGLRTADLLFDRHQVYFDRILESMTHLPFRNQSLDYITFNASFHHTPDLGRTLHECARVLKPGGIVAMVNEGFISIRHRYFSAGAGETDTGSHHEIPFREFEHSAEDAGFSIRYLVTDHVQHSVARRLGPAAGKLFVRTLYRFPLLLKQMKSVMVLLQPVHS